MDAFVASSDPNRNFGSYDRILFGLTNAGLGSTRPLLYFDLANSIPSNLEVTRVELHIFMSSVHYSDASRGYAINKINQSWQEGSLTWNTMPSWGVESVHGTLDNMLG